MHVTHPQSILVAGCSSDLGARSAVALARRGHQVIAGVREPTERGRNSALHLEELARDEGLSIRCVALDVDKSASVRAAVDAATSVTGGHLDVLVNTAAYAVLGPLEACHPDQLLDLLNTNLVGALRLFRAVMPLMRARGKGRIIQITSGLGRAVLPFMAPYAASAWAQECFAEALAMEAVGFGIEVAILEPAGYREGGWPKKPVGDQDRLAPYESQLVALSEHMQQEQGIPDDPEELATAVVHTVEAARVPLRTIVGQSARELVEMRNRLTFAEYEREILKRAGLPEPPADPYPLETLPRSRRHDD